MESCRRSVLPRGVVSSAPGRADPASRLLGCWDSGSRGTAVCTAASGGARPVWTAGPPHRGRLPPNKCGRLHGPHPSPRDTGPSSQGLLTLPTRFPAVLPDSVCRSSCPRSLLSGVHEAV